MTPFFLLPPLIGLALLGGGFYLALRFIRAFEQRNTSSGPELEELRARLARLEDALESTSGEVQRLADAQQFTTRLLEGRTETTGR